MSRRVNVRCPRCHGEGKLFTGLNCDECKGSGIVNLSENHSLVRLYAHDAKVKKLKETK